MSKAFTRESDEADENAMPSNSFHLPPGVKNYITRQGADRLQKRLSDLLDEKQRLTNPDSGEATESNRRKIEARIRGLQETIRSLVVADIPLDRQRVAFGATVRVRHENGQEALYRIVGVAESNPDDGSISWISPLARALLSRQVGDKVRFRSPDGEDELTVLAVSY